MKPVSRLLGVGLERAGLAGDQRDLEIVGSGEPSGDGENGGGGKDE